MNNLCIEKIRQLFNYDADTGILSWRVKYRGNSPGDPVGRIKTCSEGMQYLCIFLLGKERLAHRIIWAHQLGEWPIVIDHINGNGLDNRWENIRSVTHHQNCLNMARNRGNKTGITGVHFHTKRREWRAKITYKGKTSFIGASKDLFEACCLRKSAENSLGFHPNHGKRPAPILSLEAPNER